MEQTQTHLEPKPIPDPSAGGYNTTYNRTPEDAVAEMTSAEAFTPQNVEELAVRGLSQAVRGNTDVRPTYTHNPTPADSTADKKASSVPDSKWMKFARRQ
jgi:hypothetical protein